MTIKDYKEEDKSTYEVGDLVRFITSSTGNTIVQQWTVSLRDGKKVPRYGDSKRPFEDYL